MSQDRADGRLFHGTELHNGNEIANVEFGKVRFTARVHSRRAFRMEGSREEVIALGSELVIGQYAPLTVAAEYLGNAQLESLKVSLSLVEPSRVDLVFFHAENVPR